MAEFDLQEQFDSHDHSGRGSKQIPIGNLKIDSQAAMTADSGLTADGTYSANERDMLNNFKTRLLEVEAILEHFRLAKPN